MAGVSAPLRFSTRGLPDHARGPAIRALRERDLLPVEPLPHAAAAVELLKWRLPGASLMSAQLAGVRQIGDPLAGCLPGRRVDTERPRPARQHGVCGRRRCSRSTRPSTP